MIYNPNILNVTHSATYSQGPPGWYTGLVKDVYYEE